jgi:hypothetical protein
MPFIVATYVYTRSQGQRTHSARTNNNNPLKLTTSPNYQGRTKNVDFGGKLYPEELTTEDIS